METKTMNSDAVRRSWRDVLDEVVAGTDILVERYHKPVVAVIPYDDYVALQEELAERRALQRAEAAWREVRRDPATAVAWEDLKAELDAATDE